MQSAANIDNKRGYKEYDSLIKNIEGIFNKIDNILDISEYQKELNSIINDINNNENFSRKMGSSNMQLDYEGFLYAPYNKRLENLEKRINNELLPFYELYLLTSKINDEIVNITEDNINEIIRDTKTLINFINSLNTHNKKDQNNLIENAYKTVYSVILHGQVLNRDDILSYINYLGIQANKENISKFLRDDLNRLSKKDLLEDDLKNIRIDGLGYDYLSSDIIKKISIVVLNEENNSFYDRKKKAINNIKDSLEHFQANNEIYHDEINKTKKTIRNLRINKAILSSKVLSLILVPITTFCLGNMIGKGLSNQITEYKTITRTIDYQTGKVIGDIDFIYDEHPATYSATIKECSPWRKNVSGMGYVRNVVAYNYTPVDNTDYNYQTTKEILKNSIEKYRYVESKEKLNMNDSITETTFLITETYQDKEDNRKSTKYILPLTITGILLGLILDIVMLATGIINLELILNEIKKIDNSLKNGKIDLTIAKNKLSLLKKEVLEFRNQYNEISRKYGQIDSLDNIDIVLKKKK